MDKMDSSKKGDDNSSRKVDCPDSFPFPFPPYSIQIDFMKELYKTIDSNSIGIFESPTGTGKSLSIICGALQWLEHNRFADNQKVLSVLEEIKSKEDESVPSWAKDHLERKMQLKKELESNKNQSNLKALDRKLSRASLDLDHEEESSTSRPLKMRKLDPNKSKEESEESSDEYLIADYDTEEEKIPSKSSSNNNKKLKSKIESIKANLSLDIKIDSDDDSENESEGKEEIEIPQVRKKIYYCSRTHSQLSQFVNEIKKTQFARREDQKNLKSEEKDKNSSKGKIQVKVTSIGSRKVLCVNEQVSKMKSVTRINEQCLDMQQDKKKKCSYLESIHQQKNENISYSSSILQSSKFSKFKFWEYVQSKVQDIEEIVDLGKKMHTCPYYGVRESIPTSEIIALPYNTLFHKSTRESLNIQLQGNIVIIDEAHNLTEAINNMYSVHLSFAQLSSAHSQLSQYLEKYKNKLKHKNIRYIKELLFILSSLIKFISNLQKDSNKLPSSFQNKEDGVELIHKVMTVNDFVFDSKIDNINLFKIEKYLLNSQIVPKLNGFAEKIKQEESQVTIHDNSLKEEEKEESHEYEHTKHKPAMGVVQNFLVSLSNADKDGRILITIDSKNNRKSSLNYVLLNPAKHFIEIANQAKAIILAGGTMFPISDLVAQLFGDKIPPEKLHLFSCGHIIPPENMQAICLNSGPSGLTFDFTFNNRSNPKLIEELGITLINLSNIIPQGIVCFFQSYNYMEKVYNHWKTCGTLSRLLVKKKVMIEPRNSKKTDEIWKEYQNSIVEDITSSSGAILMCVVGGKLSEGINFSDGLGRCVVIVGLPYPNPNDPIISEKMKYFNTILQSPSSSSSNNQKVNGNEYYENLCMRTVNQSIGRSIRHSKDFATVLLIDKRFSQSKITSKLPKWICSNLITEATFPNMFTTFAKFFQAKKRNVT